MCIFLGQKKYDIWRDFSEKFQVLCKNPDEVTRSDGILRKTSHLYRFTHTQDHLQMLENPCTQVGCQLDGRRRATFTVFYIQHWKGDRERTSLSFIFNIGKKTENIIVFYIQYRKEDRKHHCLLYSI
jgi:hypothetical protein